MRRHDTEPADGNGKSYFCSGTYPGIPSKDTAEGSEYRVTMRSWSPERRWRPCCTAGFVDQEGRTAAWTLVVLVGAALLGGACSGVASPAIVPSGISWGAMTLQQKKAYMERVVTPRMAEVFQSYSPRTYANFGCKTCHGPSAIRGSFRMPNPDLPMTESDVQSALSPGAEPIATFMAHQVDPAMAKLLGSPASQPERHTTIGCFHCHTIER